MSRPKTSPSILPAPKLLAAARILVGLTQRDLAAAAGVAQSSIGRYEAGKAELRSDTFRAILEVLRSRGVRFLEEDERVSMGVFLERAPPGKAGRSGT